MSTSLSELTGTRSDVIPGYVLSRPGLEEIGLAEAHIAIAYKTAAYLNMNLLPEPLRESLVKEVNYDFKVASHTFGMPLYNIWVRTRTMLPYLVWLCLRVKHPQIKQEEAAKLMLGGDLEAIGEAAYELWGLLDSQKKSGDGGEPLPSPSSGTDSTGNLPPPPPTDSALPPNNSVT